MSDFSREFPIDRLNAQVLQENGWLVELLIRWCPAGDAADSPVAGADGVLARDRLAKGDLQHLRVAFRGNYMNFYCGGQSIAKVSFGHDGLQARIHEKYVYGSDGTGRDYITLTSKGFPELGTGRLLPCNSLQDWISNANTKIGTEKKSVDFVVGQNPDVIDLEMGLPAYSKIPTERRAPRIDLVALEPCEGWWRVAFWEVKLVGDGRARCRGNGLPKVVVEQLEPYADWLSDRERARSVSEAYQHNCRLLVALHAIASRFRPDIEELGQGIRATAAADAPPPLLDKKPRLLIFYDKENESFRKHGHFDKLLGAGWHVKLVKNLSDAALWMHI